MTTPDEELELQPKFLVFHGPFDRVQATSLDVKNPSQSNVVGYEVRCCEPDAFKVFRRQGYLAPNESVKVWILLKANPNRSRVLKFNIQSMYPPEDADMTKLKPHEYMDKLRIQSESWTDYDKMLIDHKIPVILRS